MLKIPEKLLNLFFSGLNLGLAVLGIVLLWWLLTRLIPRFPSPQVGLLLAVAFVFGEQVARPAPDFLWPAIAFLSISGFFRREWGIRLLLVAGGAFLFSQWSISEAWQQVFIVLFTLWFSISYTSATNIALLLLPLAVAGIFWTIPDTEEVGLLIGILIPSTVFSLFPNVRIGSLGAAPIAAVVAWVICVGGYGRPASMIVSVGCQGLLIAFPVLQALKVRGLSRHYRIATIAVLVHLFSMFIVLSLSRRTEHFGLAIAAVAVSIVISATLFIALLFTKPVMQFIRGDMFFGGRRKAGK